MKKYYLLFIPVLFAFNMHKFHLSNTKIGFNQKEKVIQITMRCFVDDIETALNKEYDTILELGNEREIKAAGSYLKTYLKAHFNIQLDKKETNITYLGKEVEKDIVFFYLEIDSITKVSNIQVESTILIKDFDDQQNVVRLDINDKKHTYVLKKNRSTESYNFSTK